MGIVVLIFVRAQDFAAVGFKICVCSRQLVILVSASHILKCCKHVLKNTLGVTNAPPLVQHHALDFAGGPPPIPL